MSAAIRRFAVREGQEPDLPSVVVFPSLFDPHFDTPGEASGLFGVRHGGDGRVRMTLMLIRHGADRDETLRLLDLNAGVGSSGVVRTLIPSPCGPAWAWHEAREA